MADQAEQVSTSGLVDTKQPPGATKGREYPEALKRRMMAETQAPGASVSIVARRHDVNSNQLFRWRRQLLPKAVVESGAMVPVEIAPDGSRPDGGRPDDGRPDDGRPRRPDRAGVIEIAFGCGARVRLRGEVSSERLRQVIELLR
jgi:transposase